MRLAILADIHGNIDALEAVIAELERQQPDHVILAGDLINAVPFSSEVIDRVRATDWIVVRGNHEFYYLDYGTERALPGMNSPKRWGQLHWLAEQIRRDQAIYLGMLPDVRHLRLPGTQPICVSHGVPGQNRVGFYQNQPEPNEVVAKIAHVEEGTVISAHTHVQVDRHLVKPLKGSGPEEDKRVAVQQWHLINPGSVGLPMNSSATAQFAIIESVSDDVEIGGWQVTHHRVDYDRRRMLESFQTSGMLDAGGVMSQLFYWQIVTAEYEIVNFAIWSRENGFDIDGDIEGGFLAYVEQTGRDHYVREQDPLQDGSQAAYMQHKKFIELNPSHDSTIK